MLYLGVDVGSLTCDAALVDDSGELAASAVVPTGARNIESIERVRREALVRAGVDEEQVGGTVATGYGRERVDGRLASVTEISCHARGIRKLLPNTDVLIDIGGQDSKAIRIDGKGRVIDFAMNDKCAAGTGRFLEAMARALEVAVDNLGQMDIGASGDLTLSSMCTVFAESEVVSLIADGAEVSEIVRGLNRAIARRTQNLVKRVTPSLSDLNVSMSGGVARNIGVVRALSEILDQELSVPPDPDIVGALGAALIARDRILQS
ncbi:acyl-CoA dehydratase activase [Myxococcota bacterium]